MFSKEAQDVSPFTPEQLAWIDRMADAWATAHSRASKPDRRGDGAGTSSDIPSSGSNPPTGTSDSVIETLGITNAGKQSS